MKLEKMKIEVYAWNEIQRHLEEKHGRQLNNFAGKTFGWGDETTPYQNFWHFLLESNDHQVSNRGSIIHIPEPTPDDYDGSGWEPWIEQIIGWIYEELGGVEEFDGRVWVEW